MPADAVTHVEQHCAADAAARPYCQKALERLVATTVAGIVLPVGGTERTDAWLPRNDGSDAWEKYDRARRGIRNADLNVDVLAAAQEAIARLWLRQLRRLSWRWSGEEPGHAVLAAADDAAGRKAWAEVVTLLAELWKSSCPELARELIEGLELVASRMAAAVARATPADLRGEGEAGVSGV